MAQAKFTKPPKPIEVNKFLGINESVGDTEIKLGEFVKSENFRITKNYKAQKRPGHHTFINFGSGDVQGIWEGEIASKNILLACWNGNVYEYDMSVDTETTAIADLITEGTVTIIGTLTDARTDIMWFNDKIYFRNGTDYKEYDGTTYQDVVTYTPTIAIGAPPAGGGTLFEEINLLSGQKKQEFIGDNSSTLYQLAETAVDSVDLVVVNGVTKTVGVDYTVNLPLGQVTFTVAPATNDDVEITWTKVVSGNADLVKNHKYMIDFGVGNDTNMFIFGNANEKHVFRFSGINDAGYFPANSFVAVGSTQFAITDLKPQYQSLLVFKEFSTKIVKPEYNTEFSTNQGLNPYNFPYFDLNEAVGNLAPKMVQLIESNPISLDGYSMWLWQSATGVEDERNAKIISDRLKLSLQGLDLTSAVTFDYQNQKEYWVNVGNVVYIWNYGNDTMYTYTNVQATQFIDVNEDIFYASDGTIERFNEFYESDGQANGTSIPCRAELGFNDFGALNLEKNMRNQWIAIEPATRTSLNIKFVTDKKNEASPNFKSFSVSYVLIDFNDIDFNEFSFLTNRNPQPKRLRAKVKKFTYLKTIFENDTNDETLTIIKILLEAQAGRISG